MIKLADGKEGSEEAREASQEAGGGGSVQRGAKEGLGSGEEITEEMMEAGFRALCESDFEIESYSRIAARVYKAMLEARRF